MAFHRGPKIVTDGLVLYYDTDNVKSYVGEPTTNLSLYSNSISVGSSSGTFAYSAGTINNTNSTSPINTNDAYLITMTNASSSWDLYTNYTGLSVGSTYTFSIYVKLNSATNFVIVVNNTLAWNTVSGSGVFTNLSLYEYKRVFITFVAPSTGSVNIHLGAHYESITQQTVGSLFLWGHQFELKSHMTPYIPTTSTTSIRSVTQGLLSLTTQQTLDLTNMSYDSNAQLTFNGTSNDIRALVSSSKTDVTLEGIVYVNLGTVGTYLSNGNDAGGYCIGIGTNFNTADNQIVGLFGAIRFIPTGVYYQYTGYHHIVMTLDGVSIPSIYINGILIGTYPGTIPNNTSVGTGFCVGSQWGIRYSNIKCNIAKFYNKKLNANEVLQNFNAIKKRFGI